MKKIFLVKTLIYGEFGNSETKMAYCTDTFKYSNVCWGKKPEKQMKTMI